MIFGECNFTAYSPVLTDGTLRFLTTTSLCLCENTLEHFTKLQRVHHAQCGHLEPPQFLRSDPATSKKDFTYFYMHSRHCGEISLSMSRLDTTTHFIRATVYAKKRFAVISNFENCENLRNEAVSKGL